MSVNTILFDFSIDPVRIGDEKSRNEILKEFQTGLENHFKGVLKIYELACEDGFLCILQGSGSVIFTIRFFNDDGLITLNIEYLRKNSDVPLINFDTSYGFEKEMVKKLRLNHGQTIPAIQRGPLVKYFPTSDERIIEYDIDRVLFEERSHHQKIQIVHSKTLGNMLVLDELQNIAESDLIYTETLMQRGKENYEGKEICILGGGDGALLYELLKEKPKFVVMLEIDEVVMKACNKYMSSICGDVLEVRKRENYEIIVGDCMEYIAKYIKEGKKFDYVFGDLTDIPISTEPNNDTWGFITSVLESSFKIIKPSGKYMTHGNGVSCPQSLKMYENKFMNLSPSVKFTKDTAFVPSFMEGWVFYQVEFVNKDN